eukprot:6502294-Prymnesium_polylepis.1
MVPHCIACSKEDAMLFDLPAELQQCVAVLLLASDRRSAQRLRQACKVLRARLALVKQQAEARRLRWLPELTVRHKISNPGDHRVRWSGTDSRVPFY